MNDLVYSQTRGERSPDFETRIQYARALMRLAAEDYETDKIVFEVRGAPEATERAARARACEPGHVHDGGGVSLPHVCQQRTLRARLPRGLLSLEEQCQRASV